MRKTRRTVAAFIVCTMIITGCAGPQYGRVHKSAAAEVMFEKGYQESYWPKSELASLLPEPEFDLGRVEWETDYGFAVLIAEIPEREFNKYVAACYQKGFNVNYQKGNTFFYADNKEGYHLFLKAQENNVMYVRLDGKTL